MEIRLEEEKLVAFHLPYILTRRLTNKEIITVDLIWTSTEEMK